MSWQGNTNSKKKTWKKGKNKKIELEETALQVNPVSARRVDPSALAFSLSSHRHSYISFVFSFRFID